MSLREKGRKAKMKKGERERSKTVELAQVQTTRFQHFKSSSRLFGKLSKGDRGTPDLILLILSYTEEVGTEEEAGNRGSARANALLLGTEEVQNDRPQGSRSLHRISRFGAESPSREKVSEKRLRGEGELREEEEVELDRNSRSNPSFSPHPPQHVIPPTSPPMQAIRWTGRAEWSTRGAEKSGGTSAGSGRSQEPRARLLSSFLLTPTISTPSQFSSTPTTPILTPCPPLFV